MKIAVTGSDGYVGAVACPRLMEAGHEVVGIDTGYYRQGWLFENGDIHPTTRTMDIRDVRPADLESFDAVVHMAELSNDPLAQRSPMLSQEVNFQGSINLAKAAKLAGVGRFIYMSSCSVYGIADGSSVLTEDSPVNPHTVYASCKVNVERELTAMASSSFAPVFLRNATIYGASPRQRFDLVLNDLCGLAWTTGRITLSSDGMPWRPLVHVRDVSEAVLLALEAPAANVSAMTLNVGSDAQNYRVIDIANIVAEVFQNCTVQFGPKSADNRSYRVGFAKIGKVLPEFKCRWTAQQGAQELYDLFRWIGLSEAERGFHAYSRLKMINHLRKRDMIDDSLRWTSSAKRTVAA